MRRTLLGTLDTSVLGLGCMGMTHAYGGADRDRSLVTLDRALELGVTMLDTADIYGPNTNEELIGEWLVGRRGRIEVATKFGGHSLEIPGRGPDGRPEYVGRACEGSLRRLNVDVIDLYYLHRVDPQVPIEETMGAMAQLVSAGKVRHLGLSEAGEETIRRAHAVHRLAAVQTEYSLWTRDVESSVLHVLAELGIGLVAYSPLGRGFLTGTITDPDVLDKDDWRRTNPRFQADNLHANLGLVGEVKRLADAKGVTAAQIALAWVLAQQGPGKPVIVAIPGTTRPDRMTENVGALDVKLGPEELAILDEMAPPGIAMGSRYTETDMRLLQT